MDIEKLLDRAIREDEDTLTEQQWRTLIQDYALRNCVDIIEDKNECYTRECTVIFKYKGKFYGITYQKKLHEGRYDDDFSWCWLYEYRIVTKTVEEWEPVEWEI